jgi:hypothetical protein
MNAITPLHRHKRVWVLPRDEKRREWIGSAVATSEPGCVVTIDPPRRSLAQNALLHALLSEAVAKGLATDNGRRLTLDEAKTAFVTAWMIHEGHNSDMVAFGGHPVQLRRSTADLSKGEFSELVEFIYSECAHRGIVLESRS